MTKKVILLMLVLALLTIAACSPATDEAEPTLAVLDDATDIPAADSQPTDIAPTNTAPTDTSTAEQSEAGSSDAPDIETVMLSDAVPPPDPSAEGIYIVATGSIDAEVQTSPDSGTSSACDSPYIVFTTLLGSRFGGTAPNMRVYIEASNQLGTTSITDLTGRSAGSPVYASITMTTADGVRIDRIRGGQIELLAIPAAPGESYQGRFALMVGSDDSTDTVLVQGNFVFIVDEFCAG